MGRSILAVVAGYLTLAVPTGLAIFGLAQAVPERFADPDTGAMAVIVVLSTLLMVLGGYVTATIARRAELKHGLALGILCELLALLDMTVMRAGRPLGYLLVIAALPIPAVLFGAWLRARRRGAGVAAGGPAAA